VVAGVPGPGVARQLVTFFCFAKRKVTKEKATLLSASLRFATGNLRCSVKTGSGTNSPAAQTSAGPDPFCLPLLGAYRRALGSDSDSDSETCSFPRWGKAGMGASGGQMPAAQLFKPLEVLNDFCCAKLPFAKSPHPSPPPAGEGETPIREREAVRFGVSACAPASASASDPTPSCLGL
jgi:hypothetical protein